MNEWQNGKRGEKKKKEQQQVRFNTARVLLVLKQKYLKRGSIRILRGVKSLAHTVYFPNPNPKPFRRAIVIH